jgi:hypothetical protein
MEYLKKSEREVCAFVGWVYILRESGGFSFALLTFHWRQGKQGGHHQQFNTKQKENININQKEKKTQVQKKRERQQIEPSEY